MAFEVLVTKQLPNDGLEELRKHCNIYIYNGDSRISQAKLLEFAPKINGIIVLGATILQELL